MQNAGDPEVQGKRVFTGRFKDDKYAFSLVPRVRFSLSSLESPAPSTTPRCMDTNFYSSHCPLEDTTGERVFCKLQVRACGNQVYVAPTAAKSIVHATSAISSSTRRAIPSGVFARLSQYHNKITRPFAREALLGSTNKLIAEGYREVSVLRAMQFHFPDYREILQHGQGFSVVLP